MKSNQEWNLIKWSGTNNYRTLANAFLRILTETENMAKSRNTLLEHLSNDVSNSLKFEIKRKEEARVKVFYFILF